MQLDDKLDIFIKNNLNVLLAGEHGTGKTAAVLAAFKRHGLKVKTNTTGIELVIKERPCLMTLGELKDEAAIMGFDLVNSNGVTLTDTQLIKIISSSSALITSRI